MQKVEIAGAIIALVSVVGAVFLAYSGKDGWWWLLFLALCVSPNMPNRH